MKKPTSNGNDLYQIGNDYPQVASAYFETSSYHDGIYTELKKDLVWDVSGVDGFDDSFFDLKNPEGLNKRILNIPQTEWADVTSADVRGDVSAVSGEKIFSVDYATAELSAFPKA
jgi:hypothetical protein